MNTYTVFFSGNLIMESSSAEQAEESMLELLSQFASDYVIESVEEEF